MIVSEFQMESITRLRVAEDAISAVLLILIIYMLFRIIIKVVKEGPLVKRLWGLIIGLLPFLLWKVMGVHRRIFIEESNPWYSKFYDFGEVLEAVSALFIMCSLIYFYTLVKPEKPKKIKSKE